MIVPIKRQGWIPDGSIQSNSSKDKATLGVGDGVGMGEGETVCVDGRALGSTGVPGKHPASARGIRSNQTRVGRRGGGYLMNHILIGECS